MLNCYRLKLKGVIVENFDLNALNQEQKKAVECIYGAVLVVAGAGSGKTRVLTYRVAYLISKGVNPHKILAITFTNKAAKEMKDRIAKMVENSQDIWISTFHAMCAKILRQHISRIDGYDSKFTIYADDDKEKVVKKLLENLTLEDKEKDEFKKHVLFHISNFKNSYLSVEEYLMNFAFQKGIDEIVKLVVKYNEELKKSNALDFDDLLYKTLDLFKACPDVLSYYANRFEYIHIDEFQDTNKVQYELAKMLASVHHNIFIVGDEDQCIYTWRGADPTNISAFQQDFIINFKPVEVFKLEQNYRSTTQILEAANKLISKNHIRIPKELWTNKTGGVKITKYSAYDQKEEASFVANSIGGLIESGYKYSDIAVLMRLNALTFPFEELFLSYNMPYAIFGGFKFFDRIEIKNIIAYLRLLVNNKDNEAFLRIINFPKRGLGNSAISEINGLASKFGFSPYEAVLNAQSLGGMSKSLSNKIMSVSQIFADLNNALNGMPLNKFVSYLLTRTGIENEYVENTEENINRKMNINSFVQHISDYIKNNPEATLSDYLQSVMLISDIDSMGEGEKSNSITVATVHSVKGLEFKVVFVIGLEEKIFPIKRVDSSDDDMEEERRLMYVAITRTKERLYLTYAKSRFLYGKRDFTIPSRFLSEAGLENKPDSAPQEVYSEHSYNSDWNRNPSSQNSYYKNNNYGYSSSKKYKESSNSNMQKMFEAKSSAEHDYLGFVVGVKVLHPKFGVGEIIDISAINTTKDISIKFNLIGVKKLSIDAPIQLIKSKNGD
jgi:DNA helicase-2/ATP-dependent DNA helicase PcrA